MHQLASGRLHPRKTPDIATRGRGTPKGGAPLTIHGTLVHVGGGADLLLAATMCL